MERKFFFGTEIVLWNGDRFLERMPIFGTDTDFWNGCQFLERVLNLGTHAEASKFPWWRSSSDLGRRFQSDKRISVCRQWAADFVPNICASNFLALFPGWRSSLIT